MQSGMNEIVTPEMVQIKAMIIEAFKERESVKKEMEQWCGSNPDKHFPKTKELIFIDTTLSELDTFYQEQWNYHNVPKC